MNLPLAQSRPRPGGRATRVVESVHAATLALLDETGYESLELPDVAARAGVNKTTVYRRWPTKVVLVADLLSALTEAEVAAPDTGSVETDLEALLAEIDDVLSSRAIRSVLRAALTLGDDDPDARAAQRAFFAQRFVKSGVIVERAVQRGELAEGTDPRRLLELVASPVYFRTLFAAEPFAPAERQALVRTVVNAFKGENT